MKLPTLAAHRLFRPTVGAAVAVISGLALWQMPLGEGWINSSYDYLFRFASRSVTNQVVVILMDGAACDALVQSRTNWNRALHAQLLDHLAAGGCPLVVFDVFFGKKRDPETDGALARAMRRHGRVVLMAKVVDLKHPMAAEGGQFLLPDGLFLQVATNWGIGKSDAVEGRTARRHWPFPAPVDEAPSLAWTAARLAGASLPQQPEEQWLRYYREQGAWETFSYHLAFSNTPAYFSNKIVFVGSRPAYAGWDVFEEDKFATPYSRWTRNSVGGVDIMVTTFLNLMNGDWLRRPAWWTEMFLLVLSGGLVGAGFCLVRPLTACWMSGAVAAVLALGAVLLTQFSNFWFPWLLIVGAQLPCALTCSFLAAKLQGRIASSAETVVVFQSPVQEMTSSLDVDTPDYERVHLLGKGGFGEVWLVRNAIRQWQALKVVCESSFESRRPYEIEFEGIEKYKPVSEKHTGLLRVEFISRRRPEGYFYYVMELGDSEVAGWESNPRTYRSATLASRRKVSPGGRLPPIECVRIVLELAQGLEFLHQHGLTHRDIKPANVIFVNGRPKLADVGLVTQAKLPEQAATRVGTPGYMPPPPEAPGTVQADIYGLGMVLYVISTGLEPGRFPELSTTLIAQGGESGFMHLNSVILNACHPDHTQRYSSAAAMIETLYQVSKKFET